MARRPNPWHRTGTQKRATRQGNLDSRGGQALLNKLAGIRTTPTRQSRGVIGEVARALGGSLVAPPVEDTQLQRYFVDLKGFGAIDEVITKVTRGVPVKEEPPWSSLDRDYSMAQPPQRRRAFTCYLGKLNEYIRRQKCIVIKKSAVQDIPNLRVSPLEAVVTDKVRIIYGFSFEVQNRNNRGGLYADTDSDSVPQFRCAEALAQIPRGTSPPEETTSDQAHIIEQG